MSKRKPAKATQRASNSKKMSRAQRAGQAIRKSPNPAVRPRSRGTSLFVSSIAPA
jgi:hypothetical protein